MSPPLRSRRAVLLAAGVAAMSWLPVPTVTQAATTAKPAAARAEQFPKLNVTDLSSEKAYDLSGLAALNTPVLLWFWAPH